MKHTIRSDTPFSISLCENDEEKSVLQNVYAILTTQKGSVPMYREFGLPMAYKDRPLNTVETILASEIIEALKEFEPRATLSNIICETSEKEPGKIITIVEVEI